MFHHLQNLEILLLKSIRSAHFNGIFYIISESIKYLLVLKKFQKVEIAISQWNIFKYSTKILRQYFNCSEL